MGKVRDLIVIGGGINGLTVASYMAKAGADVLVVERRWETGGALVTDEESGCRMNTHATYMMMMDVAPPYDDLTLSELGCTYVTPQPAVSLLLRDGRALSLYNDVEKSAASISGFSAQDAELFRGVSSRFRAVHRPRPSGCGFFVVYNENENSAPSSSLPSAQTWPPWRSTMRFTDASPTPVPGNWSARCRVSKGSKIFPA